jgi:hypothetical protein
MTRLFSLAVVVLAACCCISSAQERLGRNQLRNFDNQRFGQNRPPRGLAVHDPFTPPITAAKIRTAIDDAVYYLRTQQGADGSVHGDEGATGLTALTLLAAGADPAADDGLTKMLDWLGKRKPNNTYIRGVRANVWEYALRKLPDDAKLKALLKEDFEWLLAAKGDRQGWRYTMESRDWDNSCTQYGVLGVWAATRAGFDPGDKFWTTLSKHFRDVQMPDGGWGYVPGSGSTPAMATAGLASLFLVFDMHHGKKPYSRANPRTFTEGDAATVLKSLERGMNWLGKQQGGKDDGYYLYGIERTGVASGLRLIGGKDWFAEGALVILQAQQRDGSIPLGRWGGGASFGAINTSFCTLFLVYGGAPVAVNKLQFGKGSDWNLNPRDLANLSKALWTAYERPINWQTVTSSITSPAAEFDAPILFLSGSEKWDYTEPEAIKLRDYIERGGTILAEPSDHSQPFAESMERLLRDMYPPKDYPNVKLEQLAADHPIFTVVKHEWKNRPKLRGASNGSRTFFLLSDGYLSGDWQANREESDAFPFAMNLLFYATDLGELEGKFATILPDKAAAKAKEGTITIARVRHGRTQDWEAAGRAWDKLAPLGKHLTGRTFQRAAPVVLGKDSLKDIKLLHLTGRSALSLTEAEKTALKKFVQGGGTLLVDAHAGKAEFARTARKELEELFGKLQPLAKDPVLAEGRFENGQDLNVGVGFTLAARQAIRSRGEKSEGQKILIVLQKGRPAVLYSEYDLVAAGAGIANYRALAYKPESARKILGNVFTYLTLE